MSISRDAVGVCLLGDRLFAVGGYDGQVYLSTVEAYDPQTNEWTQVRTHTTLRKSICSKSSLLISVCSFSSSSKVLAMFLLLCKCAVASCKYCPCKLQRYGKEETKWNDLIHQKYTENVLVPLLLRGPGDFQMSIFEIYTRLKTSRIVGPQIERVLEVR